MKDSRLPQGKGIRQEPVPPSAGSLRSLIILAIVSGAIYGAIAYLSTWFALECPAEERPIIFVLLLLALLFAAYLLAVRIATKAKQNSRLLWVVIGAAIFFRVTMLFSVPIQEVDIYRYLWDGAVSAQGISPFGYPPSQVLMADANNSQDPELQKLARLRDQNPALAEILRRVHFGYLPTIYPPTSQVVFHFVAITTPNDASVATRVWIMKAWLVGFDLGVLLLVINLLSICRMPVGLSLIYAWCPLVLKEIANSGHLDAIAVFLTTLAVYLVARMLRSLETSLSSWSKSLPAMILVALVLALAIGAKLYPIVLAPLMLLVMARRLGWWTVAVPSIIFAVAVFLLLRPMLPTHSVVATRSTNDDVGLHETIPPPTATEAKSHNHATVSSDENAWPFDTAATNDPSLGVRTFLQVWEMNDFIFMILVENLKPKSTIPADQPVWFSLTPEGFRQPFANAVARVFSIPVAEAPFLITRMLTSIVFVAIALWLAWRASKRQDVASICEAGFLTLAWFWLLLPTQNPWYWLWALPLLPFAGNRAWLAVSGIVLVYYLRFWLDYHFTGSTVMGTVYQGTAFFDFVVTWVEYAPWFVWLAIEWWQGKILSSRSQPAPISERNPAIKNPQ